MSSNYLDRFKNRVNRSGDNVGDTYANNTISFIEATFSDTPTFRQPEVISYEFPDINTIDVRAVEVEVMGTLRQLLFRPFQGLNLGCYLKFDGFTWLLIDQWGDKNNYKYTAYVERCNSFLKWKDKDGNIQKIDCIASQSPLGSKAFRGKEDIQWNKFDVNLQIGQLYVYAEKNPTTEKITINQRFILGNTVYEIFGFDDVSVVNQQGYGIIQMIAKICTKQDADDFVNGIAFNQYEQPSNVTVEITDANVGLPNNDTNGGKIW